MSESPRSRKTFRWMPAPVLSHHVPPAKGALDVAVGSGAGGAFGRGLYGRKLGPSGQRTLEAPPSDSSRVPRTLLRWQEPLRYLILWQLRGLTLTWHAPWCRRCECPGAGWRFSIEDGYLSGLGFELSYFRE